MPFAVPLRSSPSKAEKHCVPLYISLRRSIIHFSPCNLAVSFSDCGNTDHRWRNYMLSIYKCCLQTLWSNKSPRLSIWNCWSEPRERRCSQMTHTPGKMSLPQLHCIETSQPQSHNFNHQTQHKKEIKLISIEEITLLFQKGQIAQRTRWVHDRNLKRRSNTASTKTFTAEELGLERFKMWQGAGGMLHPIFCT